MRALLERDDLVERAVVQQHRRGRGDVTQPLLGPGISPSDVIRTLVLGAAISGAVGHPFTRHIDDETLKAELLSIARRLVFAAS